MTELIWECLIISIVILFGINIGLAMGLTRVYKRKILFISIFYGAILFTLSIIANYATPLYNITNEYIPLIIGIIGVITILSGIYTIINWKRDKKEHFPFLSKATISSSICCFAGFIFTAILLSNKGMEANFLIISISMALSIIVLIMVFYLFSKFLRHAEKPYPVLLGNFMILNGFYFIIAALFIPNIKSMASVQTSPLSISSTPNLFFLIMAAGGVFLAGVYLTKEGIISLNDIYRRKPSNKK